MPDHRSTMPSELPPGHAPSSTPQRHQDRDTPSKGLKRRRNSPRTSYIDHHNPDLRNAPSPSSGSRRSLKFSPQPHGSSRDSDMQHSSATPPGQTGMVKYTRTGRVSKAAKGQRVHICEECGKTYTRAEHLRRHQQNHKPGAFPCDVSGCKRSFYREDLLVRHQVRHNDPLNPPSRRGSMNSQGSGHEGGSNIHSGSPSMPSSTRPSVDLRQEQLPTSSRQSMSSMPNQHSSGVSRVPRKNYIPINELPVANQLSVSVNGACADYTFNAWDGSPSSYSPARYDSPANEITYNNGLPYYDQVHSTRPRNSSSSASYYGTHHDLRSPISAGSSLPYTSQWGHTGHGGAFPNFNTSSGSESSYSNAGGIYSGFLDQERIPLVVDKARIMSAQERDLIELDQLIPSNTQDAGPFENPIDTTLAEQETYLNTFWACVHPMFSVVHKASFMPQATSPLLLAAMFALGAHTSQKAEDMTNARKFHERCMKVLKNRTLNQTHTYRVCDMQAIVLTEIYSVFKSRRPSIHLSRDFESVYRRLVMDPDAVGHTADTSMPLRMNDLLDDITETTGCKQRLLAACYVLDQQHSTLFGRPQTTCMTLPGLRLPFPKALSEWDSSLEQQAALRMPGMTSPDKVQEALRPVPALVEVSQSPHDGFQSALMMACLTDPINEPQTMGCISDDSIENSPILLAMEQSPRTRLAFHAFMLCKHTPVRELLGVAGESWVMGEKLSVSADFAAAQIEAQHWAQGFTAPNQAFALGTNQSPIQRAVYHATRILDLQRSNPSTGLIFQEWAVYLAALTIWGRAHATMSDPNARKPRLSLSVPGSNADTIVVATAGRSHELERSVVALVAAGDAAALGWSETKNVLLWVKGQIEKVDLLHTCGLTNGAVDVLGKLVSRGNEGGWFGS